MIDRKAMLDWQTGREEADRKWREEQEKRQSIEEWHRYIFIALLGIVAVVVGVALGHFWK